LNAQYRRIGSEIASCTGIGPVVIGRGLGPGGVGRRSSRAENYQKKKKKKRGSSGQLDIM